MALCATAACSASTPSTSVTTAPSSTIVTENFQVVSYHGVHVKVPVRWPVVDGVKTLLCRGPFPAIPTAFVGPQPNAAISCGATQLVSPARDGVWLQPGSPPPDTQRVTTSMNQIVREQNAPRFKYVWYHDVLVQIGIDRDPKLASAILDSIGFTLGMPDTPTLDVCALSQDPNAMPTPERLIEPLVLNSGNVILDPPAPSDQAIMTATKAWNESGPKNPYEQYRLILARYSARLPASQSPNGSLTPFSQNVLSWVIYLSPSSPTIAGCGGWGVTVFNAHTGQAITSSGWYRGP